MAEEAPRRRSRGGGGAARRAERTSIKIETAKYIQRNIPNYEVLTQEALEVIEANADIILEEVGVNFVDNPEALQRWRDAGADVQGERVRIPRGSGPQTLRHSAKRVYPTRPQPRKIGGDWGQ